MKNFKENKSHKMMKIANRVRKAAAKKWNCKFHDIDFNMCVEFAKKELDGKKFKFIEETPKIERNKRVILEEIEKMKDIMFSAKTSRDDRKLIAVRIDKLHEELKSL